MTVKMKMMLSCGLRFCEYWRVALKNYAFKNWSHKRSLSVPRCSSNSQYRSYSFWLKPERNKLIAFVLPILSLDNLLFCSIAALVESNFHWNCCWMWLASCIQLAYFKLWCIFQFGVFACFFQNYWKRDNLLVERLRKWWLIFGICIFQGGRAIFHSTEATKH